MKFIIERTSNYSSDFSPCEEAFKMQVEKWHTRTCNEEEFNRRFSDREGLWRSKGKNHTITSEGHITRQEENVERYGIEINTIEELYSFAQKYGRVIFDAESYDSPCPTIEIYDDYRE